MRTLLIDQSSSCCGYAVLDDGKLSKPARGIQPHGIFEPHKKGDKLSRRLLELQNDLFALVAYFNPDELAIEWHHYHGLNSWRAIEGLAASAQMCEMVAANACIPVYRIKQQVWKAACGAKGTKETIKGEVKRIVCNFWQIPPADIHSDDHSDVLGMAAAWAIIGNDLREEWKAFLKANKKGKSSGKQSK